MNKAIRRMWLMVAAIVVVLLLALTYVQFFAAGSLKANPWNNRTLYEQFDAEPAAGSGSQSSSESTTIREVTH